MARSGFYLDKQNNKLMGVCAGIADYTGTDVFLIRLITVLLLFLTGGVVILIYLLIGLLADRKPLDRAAAMPISQEASPFAVEELRATLSQLEQRVRELEAHYTSRSASLAREIDRLRDE